MFGMPCLSTASAVIQNAAHRMRPTGATTTTLSSRTPLAYCVSGCAIMASWPRG